ncbi:hypothetical protein HEP81_03390 [Streptomyces griseofuscus]|uniref:Uncharacterized protein n=1 Tax=Streptomyces griseofuscus TaxID=146922 RepID=A0A7H1Q066_9ACTN|nr:hypothetical protein HEP81_03390 [Streptomyces griseofuscus]
MPWGGGAPLTQPAVGAAESYRSLAVGRDGRKPRLTVTGAERGGTTVATSALDTRGSGAVKLRRPLGDRVLLDACTGRPLPYRGTGGRPR